MTVLVGVRCQDGIVIGADSVATSAAGSQPLVQIPADNKIQLFSGKLIAASTGAVGYGQRLSHHIDAAVKGGLLSMSRHDCSTGLAKRLLNDFQNSMVQKSNQHGLGFGALMALPVEQKPCLIEYGTTDFQPEFKEGNLFYVSMGSGQLLADPFLAFVSRVLWQSTMPTVQTAKFGVYWTLSHTIQLAPGGVGGPPRIATLERIEGHWTAREQPDLQEHQQYIGELEKHIGSFALNTIADAKSEAPPVAPSLPTG